MTPTHLTEMELMTNIIKWRAENVMCSHSGIGPREDLEKVIGNCDTGCLALVVVVSTGGTGSTGEGGKGGGDYFLIDLF